MNLAELLTVLQNDAAYHEQERESHYALADAHTKQALEHEAAAGQSRRVLGRLRTLDVDDNDA